MKHCNIPIFVPHQGCKNECIFCNQRTISGNNDFNIDNMCKTIEEYLSNIKEKNCQIAFFGGSFTGIDIKLQEELLKIANIYIDDGYVNSIRISTRPDYISNEILNFLKKYNVTDIELGTQSMCDDVLLLNKRGHTSTDTVISAKLIKDYGINVGLQMMVGMFGSNGELDIATAEKIAKLQPNYVRIYPTVVLEDTALYNYYQSGQFVPYSLEETVDICCKCKDIFDANDIQVIRMGLQASDNINEKSIVAGPYHSSFGELVYSRQARNNLEKQLQNKSGEVVIYANKNELSKIIGNNKCNVKYFKEKYDISLKIKII